MLEGQTCMEIASDMLSSMDSSQAGDGHNDFGETLLSTEERKICSQLEVCNVSATQHNYMQHHVQQNTDEWRQLRSRRLTASAFPSALDNLDADSTVVDLVEKQRQAPQQASQAMLHGIATEAEAAEAYLHSLRSALGEESSVELQTVGMYAHKQCPYLAASPDCLVIVTRNGQTSTHLLQIKSCLRQPQDFQQLKPQFRKQVIGELAIVRSHDPEIGRVDVWHYFQETPLGNTLHTVNWQDAEIEWSFMFPQLRLFYFQEFVPYLQAVLAGNKNPLKQSKNKLAQKRHREKTKAELETLEKKAEALKREVERQEIANASLKARNWSLTRSYELVVAYDERRIKALIDEAMALEAPDTSQQAARSGYFDGIMADLYNLTRAPSLPKLTGADCKDWHRNSRKSKEIKEAFIMHLYTMVGEDFNPSPEVRERVETLVQQTRKLRVDLSKLLKEPSRRWGNPDRQLFLEQEISRLRTFPAAMQEIIDGMELSPQQITRLVQLRRDYCSKCKEIRPSREGIIDRLKTARKMKLDPTGHEIDIRPELDEAADALSDLYKNLSCEGDLLSTMLEECMNIVTPWQEAKLAIDSFVKHEVHVDLWETIVFLSNQQDISDGLKEETDPDNCLGLLDDALMEVVEDASVEVMNWSLLNFSA